ncbi:hypothetical protein SPHINGO391_240027 [Sphingomonas aurantiaca]|uniref:Uncharacterized protein n=1 Tax=Sphingomonas aurantiaca TaxID=185949 RepID=A0A5E7XZ69_9SPHN|nr:hypothetical protein SPHINGO391_240027 [Sphingomonas aurantiaca]
MPKDLTLHPLPAADRVSELCRRVSAPTKPPVMNVSPKITVMEAHLESGALLVADLA